MFWAQHESMGMLPEALRQAGTDDFNVVIGLIEAAAEWLRTKNTDQWAQPWPNEDERDARILTGLRAGNTWIAWDGQVPAATITADPEDSQAWPPGMQRDPAVYVSRLVVNRDYSGQGMGAWLLDWAGVRARREHGALWLRLDVWTTNISLHRYYERLGFDFCGLCESVADYPSAALFQKSTDQIRQPNPMLLRETPSV